MSTEPTAAVASLPSIAEVLQQRQSRISVNEQHERSLTVIERLALWYLESRNLR